MAAALIAYFNVRGQKEDILLRTITNLGENHYLYRIAYGIGDVVIDRDNRHYVDMNYYYFLFIIYYARIKPFLQSRIARTFMKTLLCVFCVFLYFVNSFVFFLIFKKYERHINM